MLFFLQLSFSLNHYLVQLFHIAEYAITLHEMIRDEDDLPEWVQSKVSVMANNIGKIKHYLEYKLIRMGEDSEV